MYLLILRLRQLKVLRELSEDRKELSMQVWPATSLVASVTSRR